VDGGEQHMTRTIIAGLLEVQRGWWERLICEMEYNQEDCRDDY